MMHNDYNNSRREAIEKSQREARKRENEIGIAMLKRLFPSLDGPTWSRHQPPEKGASS